MCLLRFKTEAWCPAFRFKVSKIVGVLVYFALWVTIGLCNWVLAPVSLLMQIRLQNLGVDLSFAFTFISPHVTLVRCYFNWMKLSALRQLNNIGFVKYLKIIFNKQSISEVEPKIAGKMN